MENCINFLRKLSHIFYVLLELKYQLGLLVCIFTSAMSSQKGNVSKKRTQKHKNSFAWKNTLPNKDLYAREHDNLCHRCHKCVHWKLNYSHYKPLTKPKKCTKCEQKEVMVAYHIICRNCSKNLGVCAKCIKEKIGKKDEEENEEIDTKT